MKVGFTGTREGITSEQKTTVDVLFRELRVDELHHGDCKGADYDVHMLVQRRHPHCAIHIHPPKLKEHRAMSHEQTPEIPVTLYPTKDYLDRNRDMRMEKSMIAVICEVEPCRSK